MHETEVWPDPDRVSAPSRQNGLLQDAFVDALLLGLRDGVWVVRARLEVPAAQGAREAPHHDVAHARSEGPMTLETGPRLVPGSGLATSDADERGPRTPDLPPGTHPSDGGGGSREPGIFLGSRVRVHLAVHCDEPEAWEWGIVDFVYPGGDAFTVKFNGLRTEVVARYEIKEVSDG
jgi:hypothetical protein